MRSSESAGPWVVFRMPIRGTDGGNVALCSQREWDEMDRAQPGRFTLIRAGINNEGEAERLARSNNPVPPARPSTARKPPVAQFPDGVLVTTTSATFVPNSVNTPAPVGSGSEKIPFPTKP